MKISLHKRKDIVDNKWNACIEQSNMDHLYAHTWYLDIVSPDWEALILDDYSAVMPLPTKKRMGFRYLTHPCWVQQLGIFSTMDLSPSTVHSFLNNIPYLFRTIQINASHISESLLTQATPLPNLELKLSNDYNKLYEHFSTNTIRNIKKSKKNNLTIQQCDKTHEFISFLQQNARFETTPSQLTILSKIISQSIILNTGWISRATNQNGDCLAMVFFAKTKNRLVYHTSVSTPIGYELGATYSIVNDAIAKYCNTELILDFEGSSHLGIRRFFEGFGAVNHPYLSIQYNTIPQKIIKKIINGLL